MGDKDFTEGKLIIYRERRRIPGIVMSREEYERNTGGFFPYLVGKVPIRLYDGQIKVVDRVELELLTPENAREIISNYREVEEFFRMHGLL